MFQRSSNGDFQSILKLFRRSSQKHAEDDGRPGNRLATMYKIDLDFFVNYWVVHKLNNKASWGRGQSMIS